LGGLEENQEEIKQSSDSENEFCEFAADVSANDEMRNEVEEFSIFD